MDKIQVTIFPRRSEIVLRRGDQKRPFSGKRYEFLCALLEAEADAEVTREHVRTLPSWNTDQLDSISTTVSRDVPTFAIAGWQPITSGQGKKTLSWYIDTSAVQVTKNLRREARKALADLGWDRPTSDWEVARLFHDTSFNTAAAWLTQNTNVLLSLTGGNMDEARDRMTHALLSAEESDNLAAVSQVLKTRIDVRMGTLGLDNLASLKSANDIFLKAIPARKLAALATQIADHDAFDYVAKIQKLLPSLRKRGDITSLAYLYNALALVKLRQENTLDALNNIREATPLALFSGDMFLIQGVLFNFGNIMSAAHRENPESCQPGEFEALLQTDIAIRKQHRFGFDSAQAELLLSYLAWEREDRESALNYLDQAEEVIRQSQQALDIALSDRIKGLIALTIPDAPESDILEGIRYLKQAIELYEKLGQTKKAQSVLDDLVKYAELAGYEQLESGEWVTK